MPHPYLATMLKQGVLCLAFASIGGCMSEEERVIGALDTCQTVKETPAQLFIGAASRGVVLGEALEKYGLRPEWPAGGPARRAAFIRACHQFEAQVFSKR